MFFLFLFLVFLYPPPPPPISHPIPPQRLHERISKTAPYYDHFKWEEEAAISEKIALQLTEFQQLPIGAEKRSARSPRALSPGRSPPPSSNNNRSSSSPARPSPSAALAHVSQFGGAGGGGSGGALSGSAPFSAFGDKGATPFSLPTLSGLGGSRGPSAGGYGSGLATPGGSILGSLAPSAAALLAQYGFKSVPTGGAGVPAGGYSAGFGAGGYPSMSTSSMAAPPLDLSAYLEKLNLQQAQKVV